MNLRHATSEDSSALMQLCDSAPGAARWSDAAWTEILAPDSTRHVVFLAEDEDRILGFIATSFVLDVAEIENIAVDNRARRNGIGGALINALQTCAAAHQIKTLQLEVSTSNAAARAFYQSLGFIEQGRRPRYYPSGDDAVLMACTL